jgi:hypothetical protein
MHRNTFTEAMTWLEIHGNDNASLDRWKALVEAGGPEQAVQNQRRRRPRRRRGKTAVVNPKS